MKKILLVFLIVTSFSSCRVTKSLTMMHAKTNAKLSEKEYISKKLYEINFLKLSKEQISKATEIWAAEKKGLENPVLKNENIAPVIYKSEIEFRKLLDEKQQGYYPVKNSATSDKILDTFLNDNQLEELKRIYGL